MYDAGKVIPGLVVFLGLITFPVWYNANTGKTGYTPELEIPEGKCVESKMYMRSSHMDLLNDWRDRVVREGERYIEVDGEELEMSLTNGCLSCHSDKSAFCDKCHDYVGVKPYCWDCHLKQEEVEVWPSTEEDS